MKRHPNFPKDANYYIEFWKPRDDCPYYWYAVEVEPPDQEHPHFRWRASGDTQWTYASGIILVQPIED